MDLGWVWPQLIDKRAARKAIEGGVVAAAFIVVIDIAIGIYSLTAHAKVGGYYDAWVMVDGALFAIIGWRIWKNSRIWSVIGVLLMGLEIADKLQNATKTFGVITALLLLAFINAARGAFAFYKYNAQETVLSTAEARLESAPPPR